MGAAMSAPTCPHCGAEEHANYGFYLCGTRVADTECRWYPVCYQRQLAAKDAEIEGLKHESEYWQKAARILMQILMRGNKVK